ncbi:hypothetical protein AB5I41_24355 [Sphingomonas sp. MMS24-JH45]
MTDAPGRPHQHARRGRERLDFALKVAGFDPAADRSWRACRSMRTRWWAVRMTAT